LCRVSDLAIVVEDLVDQVAGALGPKFIGALDRHPGRMVELDLLAGGEHHLDAALRVHAELLLAGEEIGRRLEQRCGPGRNLGWLRHRGLRQPRGKQQRQGNCYPTARVRNLFHHVRKHRTSFKETFENARRMLPPRPTRSNSRLAYRLFTMDFGRIDILCDRTQPRLPGSVMGEANTANIS
jgi:hypothetical protein